MDYFNSSLSPMTTCELICIFHHSNTDFHSRGVQIIKNYYIQSRCRFLNTLPLPQENVYQPTPTIPHHISSYSSYLASSIRYRILHVVSSASFLSSPYNFLPLQDVFMGPYRKFQPTDSLICISYIHFVVALYI